MTPGYDVDLLVAGAGPVGLGAAIEAALAGLSVAVLDPRQAPTDKACGEGLMPPAVAALARLGVAVPGMPFVGIDYVDGARRARADFAAGPGLGVRRTTLSAAMDARAREVGVHRLALRVGSVDQVLGEVAGGPGLVAGGPGVVAAGLRAHWLVAADGLHSPVRRGLGVDRPPSGHRREGLRRYGLRRHFHVAPWTDRVEVHWARDAEAYVTPVGPNLVGVAILCPGREGFDAWLGRFPALLRRLAGAEPAGAVHGAGPLRQAATRHVVGRVLLVGDAAGYVDALTGEGVAVGLACAREAVRCVVQGRPQAYEAAWRRTTRRYRTLTGGLVWAAQHPGTRRWVVPAAAAMPAVFAAVVNRLG